MRLALTALVMSCCLMGCLPKKKASKDRSPKDDTTPGNAFDSIFGGKPSKLDAYDDALYAEADACVSLNLQVLDAEEIQVTTETDVTVNLTADPSTTPIYSDKACSNQVKTLTIPKGNYDASAFTKTPASGKVKIDFTDAVPDGLTKTETTLAIAIVSELSFLGGGIPQNVGECEPQAVLAQDAEGHQVLLAKDVTLTATSGATSGKFYTDEECKSEGNTIKILAGSAESQFIYYKDNAAGTPAITISANGNTTWKKATASITVTSLPPASP
jgi:hypothetical protein